MSDSAPKSQWDSATGGVGLFAEWRPQAYDPMTQPELFEGVLARRFVAFVIDLVIIALPLIAATIFIFILGLITFGLGWALYWMLSPASVIWALFYYGSTLGGPASATLGMRSMGLQMRTWYGAPCYFLLGAVNAIVYWITVSVLTPFVLLVGLFNQRKRLLHDMLVGTVVINTAARAAASQSRLTRHG
jgi:uncharacterized RDD family membrane protein YckC